MSFAAIQMDNTALSYSHNWQRILPFSTCTTHPLLKLRQFVLLTIKGG